MSSPTQLPIISCHQSISMSHHIIVVVVVIITLSISLSWLSSLYWWENRQEFMEREFLRNSSMVWRKKVKKYHKQLNTFKMCVSPGIAMWNYGRIRRADHLEGIHCCVNEPKNCKAPGLNRVPPDKAFKAMDSKCHRYVFDFLTQYFNGERDYGWHKSQCVPIPKSGDLSDPNKWQEVSLMDLWSKIVSCMMNVRLFKTL